jgi:hypothetical protein
MTIPSYVIAPALLSAIYIRVIRVSVPIYMLWTLKQGQYLYTYVIAPTLRAYIVSYASYTAPITYKYKKASIPWHTDALYG